MANVIVVKEENGYIVIRASVDDLKELAETHAQYPFKVTDKNLFSKEFVMQLENYATQNEVEIGSTHTVELFENILEQIGQSGLDFIEIIDLD